MVYDKYQLLKNIRFLLGNRDIQMGTLEQQSGYQQGYVSRLEKQKNKTEPTLEFVLTAAKMLGVSAEYLCYSNVGKASAAEDTIVRFLAKLSSETVGDKITWVERKNAMCADISRKAHVKLEEDEGGYNLFLNDKPLIFADECTQTMQLELEALCNYAKESISKLRIDNALKGAIDEYLTDEEG